MEGQLFISILKEDNAVDILKSMDESGALKELLPELCALKDNKPGHKDNFVHTLKVLQNVIDMGGGIELRLTAIFHDLGKAETKRYDSKKGYTFHDHENISGNILRRVFRRLQLPTDSKLFKDTFLLVTLHGRPKALTEEGVSDSAIRRLLVDCGSPEIANLLLDFVTCDTTTSNEFKRKKYKEEMISLKKDLERIIAFDEDAKWRAPINGFRIMELTGIKGGTRSSDGSMMLANLISELKHAIKSNSIENTVEASEQFILDKYKSLNMSENRYGQLPKVIGEYKVDCLEMMFYQDMPIKFPNENIIYESRLNYFSELIETICIAFINEYGYEEYDKSYIYVSAKYLYQALGCPFNRPGWHCDGFMSDDINYIWSDKFPTVYNNSKFNLTMDQNISIKEMDEQALSNNNISYPNNTLVRLNQFVVHTVGDVTEPGFRTFLKVTFSKEQYNLLGNTYNYRLDYKWDMTPRSIDRNPTYIK